MYCKNILVIAVLITCFAFRNRTADSPPGKRFNIFYVDNSKFSGKQPLSNYMVDILSNKIDSLKSDKNSMLSFFMSNGQNPDYSKSPTAAKKMVANIYNGYSAEPSSIIDKGFLNDRLFSEDLSNIESVNVYFFVTENYLENDLMAETGGFLLKFLPKQLQALTKCKEENINVYLYYPKASSIRNDQVVSFLNFSAASKTINSKIHFYSLPY